MTAFYSKAVSHGICMIALLAAAPIARADVLDQEWSRGGVGIVGSINGGVGEKGQSFTVGVNGRLTRIAARLRTWPTTIEPLTVTVYATTDGLPSESLGSIEVPPVEFPWVSTSNEYEFVAFDLRALAVDVVAGELMAFGLSSDDSYVAFGGSEIVSVDPFISVDYLYGEFLVRSRISGDWSAPLLSGDLWFQSFVEPVPEPHSAFLAVVAFGIAGIVWKAKRTPQRVVRALSRRLSVEQLEPRLTLSTSVAVLKSIGKRSQYC